VPTYLTPGVYVEEIRDHPGSIDGVRTSTASIIEQSLGAFASVDDARRGRIGDAMVRIVTAVLTSSPRDRDAPGPSDIVLDAVDFPDFVAGLLHGVFGAIVGASVQQMEAYADLLADVAKTVDEVVEDHVCEDEARDLLTRALLAGVAASAACAPR
jgi:phage tail sheath protein FI